MFISEKQVTAAGLWQLSHDPAYADVRLELSQGELVVMSPAGGEYGVVAGTFFGLIWNFVREHKTGYVTAAETGYILAQTPDGRDTVRAPDVGFVAKDRLPDGLPQGYIPSAPDLAVEVVSPNDEAEAVQRKVMEYLRHGTRLMWVVYPRTRSVVVHTAEKAITLDIHGTLDGDDVLPGFHVPVGRIFDDTIDNA
jgi:Uma2 family endonuclease